MEFTGERLVPTIEGFDDLFLEHMSRYIFAAPLVKEMTVLDAGCGAGYGSYHLLRAGAKRVMGIDISSEAVDYCRTNYLDSGITFEKQDVFATKFPSRSFDAIVSFEVFEHLNDPEKYLTEMRRILKPDGLYIVSTPNANTYVAGGEDGENEYHFREYTPEEFGEMLGSHFRSIHWFAQSPLGGLGIVPVEMPTDSTSLQTETRLIGPPSHSTWGEAQQLRVSIDKCDYTIAICSPTETACKNIPNASLFAMGNDFAMTSGQDATLLENRDSLVEDVKKRDTLICHLQEDLDNRGSWAQELQSEIDERDETIRFLQGEIEREIPNRDEMIRKLQTELDDRSRWALALDAQVKAMSTEVEKLKRNQNSIL